LLTCGFTSSKIAKSAVGPQAKGSRSMPIGRAARRAAREQVVQETFGPDRAAAVLDLLELLELAWHDCYGDVTPPEDVIDDVLAVAQGDMPSLARAARLAVEDSRDLRLAADEVRQRSC
jgi:hypothetical protein